MTASRSEARILIIIAAINNDKLITSKETIKNLPLNRNSNVFVFCVSRQFKHLELCSYHSKQLATAIYILQLLNRNWCSDMRMMLIILQAKIIKCKFK